MELVTGDTLEFDKICRLLARCSRTPMGGLLAEDTAPTSDIEEVRAELDLVGAVRRNRAGGEPFTLMAFAEITPDVPGWKAAKPVLEGIELYRLAAALREAEANLQLLESMTEEDKVLGRLVEGLAAPDWIAEEVLAAIDADGNVLDEASPELARLRATYRKTRNGLNNVLKAFFDENEHPGYVMDDFITIRSGRMVIPIKIEHRSRHQGIVHDRSRGGDSLFFEPIEAVELNNSLASLLGDIAVEEAKVLARLTATLYTYWDDIARTLHGMARLDYISAKAALADVMDAVQPEITADAPLSIISARHPLLDERLRDLREEAELREQAAGRKVVPVDIELGGDWRVLVVTGPNAGGKTVSLKTAGLLALMAQSGMHVPAASYTGPAFRSISADIGDAQDIIKHLSSFSSHLSWLKENVERLVKPALLLMDEIASATDPGEGSALAMAALELLRDEGAYVMASTHLEALKAFAHAQEGMQNCCVEFDPESLKPTYRLSYGLPGKSNALETAKEIGLPKHLLDRAYYYLGDEGAKSSEIIGKLQEELTRLNTERQRVEEQSRELDRARKHYAARLDEVEMKAQETIDAINKEWRDYRRHQDKELHDAIERIKLLESSQAARAEVRERISERDEDFGNLSLSRRPRTEAKADNSPLVAGDNVVLVGLGQSGRVVRDWNKDGGGPVHLEVRGKRLTFPRSAVAKGGSAKQKPSGGGSISVQTAEKSVRTELNLIGKVVEEALDETEKFIDDALVHGLTRVNIIHGRGTGRLRRAIEEYLKQQPMVASWQSAPAAAGGDAVTEVELTK